MNLIRTLITAAILAAAQPALAQSCSGGPDGGMDAAGNQCSQFTAPAPESATVKVDPPQAQPAAKAHNTASARRGHKPKAVAVVATAPPAPTNR